MKFNLQDIVFIKTINKFNKITDISGPGRSGKFWYKIENSNSYHWYIEHELISEKEYKYNQNFDEVING
jgi:hypothetical protein